MNFKHLNEDNLNKFKALLREDQALQNLTFTQLQAYAASKAANGENAQTASDSERASRFPRNLPVISNCFMASAGVFIDCTLFIIGAVPIARKMLPASLVEVATIIEHEMPQIDEIAKVLGNAGATQLDKALAIYRIAKLAYSGGMLEAVYKAITKSLTWWDMILYGVIGLAELTAAFLTDGVVLVLEIIGELATAGFIISDAVKVSQECAAGNTQQRSFITSESVIYLEGYDPLYKKFSLTVGTNFDFAGKKGLMIGQNGKFSLSAGAGHALLSGDSFKLKCVPPADVISVPDRNGPGNVQEILDTFNNADSGEFLFVDNKYVSTPLEIRLANKLSTETNIKDGDRVYITPSTMQSSFIGYFGQPAPVHPNLVFSARPYEWVIRKVT